MEPTSFAAIDTGLNRLFEAMRGILDSPLGCAGHSDILLAEIPVE